MNRKKIFSVCLSVLLCATLLFASIPAAFAGEASTNAIVSHVVYYSYTKTFSGYNGFPTAPIPSFTQEIQVPLKIYYDSNTGKISSVQCLSLIAAPPQSHNDGRAEVSSVVKKTFTYSLSADKYSVTFNVIGDLVVDFWDDPSIPAGKVTQVKSFTISDTKTPETP